MPTLLHIESSPRKTRSASLDVARAYLEAYRDAHPDHSIDVLDLWSIALPEFDGDALDAKYADLSGTPLSEAQQQAWAGIRHVAQRLHDADTLLLSVPLWNFSIPYKLKHFIDVVSQRNILFSFDERGSAGLLKGKQAVVIYARGLDYSMRLEHTRPFVRFSAAVYGSMAAIRRRHRRRIDCRRENALWPGSRSRGETDCARAGSSAGGEAPVSVGR